MSFSFGLLILLGLSLGGIILSLYILLRDVFNKRELNQIKRYFLFSDKA